MKSWKTSTLGVVAIVVAIGGAINLLADGNPATMPDWNAVAGQVAVGLGLMFSQDHKKATQWEDDKP